MIFFDFVEAYLQQEQTSAFWGKEELLKWI
jgi:hypothetical protein